MLTFDAPTHVYRYNGDPVVSVTQALAQLRNFSMISPEVLEHKRQIGVAVDKAVELDIDNDLEEGSLDESIVGYFRAWKSFRAATLITIIARKVLVWHPEYRYAGELDLIGAINGVVGVYDVKTSDPDPINGLQLAGYQGAYNHGHPIAKRATGRHCIHLRKDGTFQLERHAERTDFFVFTSCVALHYWKQNHKR